MSKTKTYKDLRQAYWDAQREFRIAAVREIARLIPERYKSVCLEMSDDPAYPRLRISHFRTPDGEDDFDYEASDEWEEIDQIAADMEAFTWDGPYSFLPSTNNSGWELTIDREDTA